MLKTSFLRESLLPTAALVAAVVLTGCGPVRSSESISAFRPDRAYVIIGHHLGDGNISRCGSVVYADADNLGSKGVQDQWFRGGGLCGYNGHDYMTTEASGGYRVWEVDLKASGEPVRAAAWLSLLANTGDGIYYQVDNEKQDRRNFFTSSGWLYEPIEEKYVEELRSRLFLGAPFLIAAPGVYYLGEITVSGKVVMSYNSYTTATLDQDWSSAHGSDPESARARMAQLGAADAAFHDLSGEWRWIPSTLIDKYINADETLPYARP